MSKVGFDNKRNQPIYNINWRELFEKFQSLLIETIIEETHSKYHVRVLRVLKQNGFLEEKELIKMSLLSVQHVRTIVNQLLSESYVEF